MTTRISYAQNAEDIRVWRAFEGMSLPLTYVDVGANEPRELSITASLYDLGWRGLLVEADPMLAAQLRLQRVGDVVVECLASDAPSTVTFYRVPGTGLGTMNKEEAQAAFRRGFQVEAVDLEARTLTDILNSHDVTEIHFMSIDVEGAEAQVLAGLDLQHFRPWVMCIEAIVPGGTEPAHQSWEGQLLAAQYTFVTFDGINRWYVANEHRDLADAVALPFNALDVGIHGWVSAQTEQLNRVARRSDHRQSWQREIAKSQQVEQVSAADVAQRMAELEQALALVETSRSWRWSRKIGRIARGGIARVEHFMRMRWIQQILIRRRHRRLVVVNQKNLTEPAYLTKVPMPPPVWANPEQLPSLPPVGFAFTPLTDDDCTHIREWLLTTVVDDDATLMARTDQRGDELGRVMDALWVRCALSDSPVNPHWAGGNRILIDARALQTSAFGHRGIGRFARSTVLAAREAVGDDRCVLVVDPALEPLPQEIAGSCQQVNEVTDREVSQFSVFIEPSPMTASIAPIIAVLHSAAHKVAVVYDFIPKHFPSIYLRYAAERAEYAAGLDALRMYDAYVCISRVARDELTRFLGPFASPSDRPDIVVGWPAGTFDVKASSSGVRGNGSIVIMTGDEPRKNTYGALAAVGLATAGVDESRDVVVVGMAGLDDRVHHWAVAAGIRPGQCRTVGRLSDDDMHALLADADLVVVSSFDEGLSLPVIEALQAGTPVVASRIPSHRELLYGGSALVPAGDIPRMARAIRKHRNRLRTHRSQVRALRRHRHVSVEAAIKRHVLANVRPASVAMPDVSPPSRGRLSVGIATPWLPQRSGVADFSYATTLELAKLCDLTVYTTADTDVGDDERALGITRKPVQELLYGDVQHDVIVNVVGNSHFHVPNLSLSAKRRTVVVSHDTRLVEMYMALRGTGGAEQLMLRGTDARELSPPLDEQIDDMRLLQNAGFWEVAHQAQTLVLHSPSAAPRIASETGIQPVVLPFANQRVPTVEKITDEVRHAARARLGFTDEHIHLATFGFVDVRTKLTDVVVESAAWLRQWGYPVALHIVGAAHPEQEAALRRRASEAGLEHFTIVGYTEDAIFRDYLLAVDIGIQLRIGPLLGVSGPLSDLAAFGTTSVASRGLCIDVDTPDYVVRLPDDISPLLVAEAVEGCIRQPRTAHEKESERLAYLDRHTPARYAHLLMEVLTGQVER